MAHEVDSGPARKRTLDVANGQPVDAGETDQDTDPDADTSGGEQN